MKLPHLLSTSIVAFGLLAGSAFADTIEVKSTANYHDPLYEDDGGGEIKAITTNYGTFLTFCLERGIDIHKDTDYTYDVGSAALFGGQNFGGEVGFDPLSNGTAWLYLQFSKGTLGAADGTYDGADRRDNAGLLQLAIWALEDEIPWDATNYYLASFGDMGWAKSNYMGNQVAVLNPWIDGQRTPDVQSLLVRVPDGGSSAVLLGLGLISVALIRRRK